MEFLKSLLSMSSLKLIVENYSFFEWLCNDFEALINDRYKQKRYNWWGFALSMQFPLILRIGEGSFKGVKMIWSLFNFKSPLGSLTEEYGSLFLKVVGCFFSRIRLAAGAWNNIFFKRLIMRIFTIPESVTVFIFSHAWKKSGSCGRTEMGTSYGFT